MKHSVFSLVGIAALGYFVDIFDLALFGIVRVPSLRDLGIAEDQLLPVGVRLLNAQMTGLLVGGLIWGILGDKFGRIKVLFGSILLYSLANLANAGVDSAETYAWLRFIAGLGLAGELGAAITLVSESISKENRGYGTAIVAGFGLSGAVAAGLLAEWVSWRMTYAIGGLLGLLLLFLRFQVSESKLFNQIRVSKDISKGSLILLFSSPKRLVRYGACILIAVPIWYCAGILMTFAPEIGVALGATAPLSAGKAILFSYIGVSIGDVLSGVLSQFFRSRKKIIGTALLLEVLLVSLILRSSHITPAHFYFLAFFIGLTTGYWAIFITVTSEQFGTNLRSTVTTSVPNFVRASVVPMTLALTWLRGTWGILTSVILIGGIIFLLAGLALLVLEETFAKDLNYLER